MAWSTTFYYEQELRSSYMNNVVKGLIKPGVYNLNAALYTLPYDEISPGSLGLWLRIKKGSTFVFSNGYEVVDGKLKRNLEQLGSYVVKCVAEDDTDIHLATPGGNYSAIFEEAVPGSGVPIAPVIFVYASFTYEDDAVSSSKPNFRLAVPSSNEYLGSNLSYMLPNEDWPQAAEAREESYLLIGALLDNNKQSANYISASNWRDASPYEGRSAWLANHVFTARGLPEYKGAVSKNYGQQLAGILFGREYNKLFITSGSFYYNSILYQIDGQNWKTIYGQGGAASTAVPVSSSGAITDHAYGGYAATTYTKALPTLTADKLLVEFYFLAVRSEYARAVEMDLSAMFSGTGFSVTRRVLPYRIECDAPEGIDFNSMTALSEDFGFSAGTSVVPLDTSILNLERLKSYLQNRNVLMPVVDKMRQAAETASPFLIPSNGETLVPIAVSFRKVNSGGTDMVDAASSISFPVFKDASGTLNTSAVNPSNVLSFFELQASSFAIFSTSLSVQEVFDVLPFLD